LQPALTFIGVGPRPFSRPGFRPPVAEISWTKVASFFFFVAGGYDDFWHPACARAPGAVSSTYALGGLRVIRGDFIWSG